MDLCKYVLLILMYILKVVWTVSSCILPEIYGSFSVQDQEFCRFMLLKDFCTFLKIIE